MRNVMTRRGGLGLLTLVLVAIVGAPAGATTLYLSEIAWAGTAAGSQDEWIELGNAGTESVDLAGWVLQIGDLSIPLGVVAEATIEVRTASVAPGAFLLLERTDDTTVADIDADFLFKGSLPNDGADVRLVDPMGRIVDELCCADLGWPGGSTSSGQPAYATMERVDPEEAGQTWRTHGGGDVRCGVDAQGNPLCGTPRAENAASMEYRATPRVTVHEPADAVADCPVIVRWSAVDPDGLAAALAIRISVRAAGEEAWTVVAEGLSNQGSYAWECQLGGTAGDVELRVEATDGDGRTGDAVVGPFAVSSEP
ncbi:MAG: lamin tail domain-containing protein [Candidatus Bipolaricaulota bacterium]